MFNEFSISLITIYMISFTDFVINKDTQFEAGWQMIGIMAINTSINMLIVLAIGFKSIILLGIRWFRYGYFYGKYLTNYISELSIRF